MPGRFPALHRIAVMSNDAKIYLAFLLGNVSMAVLLSIFSLLGI